MSHTLRAQRATAQKVVKRTERATFKTATRCPSANLVSGTSLRVQSTPRSNSVVVRATAEEKVEVIPLGGAAPTAPKAVDSWVPVVKPEELPKGVRKEVYVNGRNVLLFWYRNQIFCTETRSPAEGAYSEGFIASKFTQEYGIECPSTGTVFSLKDGSILDWYPNNPFMKALMSPSTCRKLEIYPVKLTQEAIYIDTSKAQFSAFSDKGGADTSLEGNNVFAVQPKLYYEGTEVATSEMSSGEAPKQKLDPIILATGTLAVGMVGAVGTAIILFIEEPNLLVAFWAVLFGVSLSSAASYVKSLEK